jgi:hypothetical protein
MDVLNDVIARAFTGAQHQNIVSHMDSTRKINRFEAFLDVVASGTIMNDRDVVTVLRKLVDPAKILASAVVEAPPKDLSKIAGMLHPFMVDYSHDHELFQAIVHLWTTLASQVAATDTVAATLLLSDHLLPRLSSVLTNSPYKRPALLRLIYAFVPATVVAHIQVHDT